MVLLVNQVPPVFKAHLELQDLKVLRASQDRRDLRDYGDQMELVCQDRLEVVCQDLPVTLASSGMSVTIHHTYVEVARRCVLILMTVTSVSVLMVMRSLMIPTLALLLKDVQL
jgi:hypothetical protein